MFRGIYNWTIRLAETKNAPVALAAVSFAESSFFPIPPDVMLVPMCLARPKDAYKLATICAISSVLGGILGYAIGYYFQDFGEWLLSLMGHRDGLAEFQHWYDKWGAWVILLKGLTPIPYKLVTVASGLAKFDFGMFVLTSAITRAVRFYITAMLLNRFGPEMREVIEKRINLVAIASIVFIVGGIFLVGLL